MVSEHVRLFLAGWPPPGILLSPRHLGVPPAGWPLPTRSASLHQVGLVEGPICFQPYCFLHLWWAHPWWPRLNRFLPPLPIFLFLFQSGTYSEQVEDTLKEYVRMVLSFKASNLRPSHHAKCWVTCWF